MIIKMFRKTKRKKERKKKVFRIFICSIHKIVLIKKKKKNLRQKNAQVVLLFVLSFDSVFP